MTPQKSALEKLTANQSNGSSASPTAAAKKKQDEKRISTMTEEEIMQKLRTYPTAIA